MLSVAYKFRWGSLAHISIPRYPLVTHAMFCMHPLQEVYGFNLPGHSMLYHCRLRPHAKHFLEKVSQLYEMHIFTMATNSYAATVANILDPEKKLFCDRIISRDECFDPQSKTLRLRLVLV